MQRGQWRRCTASATNSVTSVLRSRRQQDQATPHTSAAFVALGLDLLASNFVLVFGGLESGSLLMTYEELDDPHYLRETGSRRFWLRLALASLCWFREILQAPLAADLVVLFDRSR